jgi:catechol 2,3-dioxygenase-like lactoylglutathione lyase family enzyme
MAKLRHIALSVPDPVKAAEFYEKAFGMKRVGEAHVSIGHGVYLSDGTVNLALLRYTDDEAAGVEQAAKTWGDANGVTVKLVPLPFGAFDSKVETAVPRGNGPDLFIAAHASLGKWDAMGLVQPVEASLLDGHRPATRAAMSINSRSPLLIVRFLVALGT